MRRWNRRAKGQTGAGPELGRRQIASGVAAGGPTRRQTAELRPAGQIRVPHSFFTPPVCTWAIGLSGPYRKIADTAAIGDRNPTEECSMPSRLLYNLSKNAPFRAGRLQVWAP